MSVNAINGRKVSITFTGAPMPVDAYKAVINKVSLLEEKNRLTAQTNIASQKVLVTGTVHNYVHVFTTTVNFENGTYSFGYVETVENASKVTETVAPEQEV